MGYLLKPYIASTTGSNWLAMWHMPDMEIPDTWLRFIDSIELQHAPKFVTKHTGFEATKHRVAESSTTDGLRVDVSILLVGDLPHYVADTLRELATGINGSGCDVIFHDTVCSDAYYYGKWTNAAEFADNAENVAGGRIDITGYLMTT